VLKMPRCEGRPEGDCPNKQIDGTVRNRQGDLMLCDECTEYRFPTPSTSSWTMSWSTATPSKATKTEHDKTTSYISAETLPIIINTELCNKPECLPSVETVSKRVSEVNELLCFLHNKYHNHPLSLVRKRQS